MRSDQSNHLPEKKITLKQRLHYTIENTLARGTTPSIIWLTILTFMIALLFGLVFMITGVKPNDANQFTTIEAFWQSFLHVIDTGAIQGDSNWDYRSIALILTLLGVFIFSALISVLTTGLDKTLLRIAKGRSTVLEKDYTLILGWTDKIFKIVSELVEANASQKRNHIVIMANRTKSDMEDDLRAKVPHRKTTHVIIRTGNPLDLDDLVIVAPHKAKSIIVLASEDKNPDSYVIKSILAIDNILQDKKNCTTHIVAELRDKTNIEAVEFWKQQAEIKNKYYIYSQDLLARVTAQTTRQSGYSAILTELLNYERDEIYFRDIPSELVGKTFMESLFLTNKVTSVLHHKKKSSKIENITVFGMKRGDKIYLNPLMKDHQVRFEKNDQLIAIAEDDYNGTLKLMDKLDIDEKAIADLPHTSIEKENILILGWNEACKNIITELYQYLKKDSKILIVADIKNLEEQIKEIRKGKNWDLQCLQSDTTNHKILKSLEIEKFDDIVVLGYAHLDIQEKDAKTLLTLLHLRKIIKMGKIKKEINIVSEMSDDRNRRLAEISSASDFIISENIISTMMAQLSETKELKPIFDDLFDVSGCEIYLRPVTNYINAEIAVNFNTILKSAALKKEVAIGYRKISEAEQPNHYGVYLNPLKLAKVKFEAKDKIIVIAQS